MEPTRRVVALSIFALAVLYTQAAPATDYLGPPRTLEGDTDINPIDEVLNKNSAISPKLDNHEDEDVIANERFHRVNEDGTIEFKTALSNGHIQYQRISNKVVDGKTIQVYEGYISQRYPDGRYATTYYIADENGYRRTRDEVDTRPPVLPRNIQELESATKDPLLEENKTHAQSGTKVLTIERHGTKRTTLPGIEEELSHGNRVSEEVAKRQIYGHTALSKNDGEHETTLDTTDENSLKTSEDEHLKESADSAENQSNTDLPALSSAEETATKDGYLESTTSEQEEIEGSGELPSPAVDSVNNTFEDTVQEASTPVPNVEENVSKSSENALPLDEISTELTASIDNEDLEPITELVKTEGDATNIDSDSQDHVTSSVSTTLPTWEQNVNKDIEASTDIPILPTIGEDHAEKSAEDDTTQGQVNTELSTSNTGDLNTETPVEENNTNVAIDEDINASTELNQIASNEASTGVPTLTVSEEDAAQSESSTELPTLYVTSAVTEENLAKNEDDVVYLESSTELLALDVSSASTGVPELPVSEENLAKNENDVLHSESSTELPAFDMAAASTEVPAFPDNAEHSNEDTQGVFVNDPTLSVPAVNLTKSDEHSRGDLLGLGNSANSSEDTNRLKASTEVSSDDGLNKVSEEDLHKTEQPTEEYSLGAITESQELPSSWFH